VLEAVVEKDAVVEHYNIQNDERIRTCEYHPFQANWKKSNIHSVYISLNGGIVRNNLNMVMEAAIF
jgi:Fe-S cluster assembly protein SufD